MSAFALFYTPNGIVAITGKEAVDAAILKFQVGLASGEISGVAVQLEKTGSEILGAWNDASLMKGLMEAGGKADWNSFAKEGGINNQVQHPTGKVPRWASTTNNSRLKNERRS